VQKVTVCCQLSDVARRAYEDMKTKQLLRFAEAEIPAVSAGVLVNKLLQIANGAIYDENKQWHGVHTAKLEALMDVVEESDGQLIVVYQYQHDRDRILSMFEERAKNSLMSKLRYRVLKTSQDEDDWNAGKIDVLLLHPASAGHGLNLHKSGAKRLVHFSMNPDLDQYLQVNARLFGGHRGKGRQGVLMHLVAENTVDEKIMTMLAEKTDAQDQLMRGTSSSYLVSLAQSMLKESKGDWLL